MKYMILLVGYDGVPDWSAMTDEMQAEFMQAHERFEEAVARAAGCEILASEALTDATDATVFTRDQHDNPVLTDGCYAEALEHFGGFYLLRVPDLDAVVQLCRQLPRYVIEIRPVLELGPE